MKWIEYKIAVTTNHGTVEEPNEVTIFYGKRMAYSEINEEIAKREAYNGEYTIEDDGVVEEPTWQDKIEAQVTYNSMMLGTLIEEV